MNPNNEFVKNQNTLLFINKKTKKLAYVQLEKINGKVQITISNTDDGIILTSPLTNDPVVNSLPESTNDLIKDSLAIIKHFKYHEYKPVNTISSTKKGLRFS